MLTLIPHSSYRLTTWVQDCDCDIRARSVLALLLQLVLIELKALARVQPHLQRWISKPDPPFLGPLLTMWFVNLGCQSLTVIRDEKKPLKRLYYVLKLTMCGNYGTMVRTVDAKWNSHKFICCLYQYFSEK